MLEIVFGGEATPTLKRPFAVHMLRVMFVCLCVVMIVTMISTLQPRHRETALVIVPAMRMHMHTQRVKHKQRKT